MRRKLQLAAIAAFVIGVVARYQYILVEHHPRHHVISDVRNMLVTAGKMLAGDVPFDAKDTIWPPGTSAVVAGLLRVDPSLGFGAWLMLLQSVAVPIIVAHTALLLFGPAAGWVALAAASLHFGLIHYGGFFLSEQFFQFAVALALWLTVVGLDDGWRRTRTDPGSPPTRRDWVRASLMGCCAGLGWMYATSFRPTALPLAAVMVITVGVFAWKARCSRIAAFLAGGIFVGFVTLHPLADRCTRLDGEDRCLVSNNITMNMVLGQAGEVRGVTFRDPEQPERTSGWSPPSLGLHGYSGSHTVPFTIYDEGAAIGWLWERFTDAPGGFMTRAIGNALDLSSTTYWPRQYATLSSRFATVAGQVFNLLVLAPAVVAWVLLLGRARRRVSPQLLVVLTAPVALLLSAAATMGEARYRTPLDGVFIALAAALYAGAIGSRVPQPQAAPWWRAGVWVSGVVGAAALLAILLISHPLSLVLAKPEADNRVHALQDGPRIEVLASSLSEVRKAKSKWNAKGNYVFECLPECPELHLSFEDVTKGKRRLELSLDSNDAYQIAFYRSGRLLSHHHVAASRKEALRVERMDVPQAARDGFDAVGVLPLYGDGRYSVGHVRVE